VAVCTEAKLGKDYPQFQFPNEWQFSLEVMLSEVLDVRITFEGNPKRNSGQSKPIVKEKYKKQKEMGVLARMSTVGSLVSMWL